MSHVPEGIKGRSDEQAEARGEAPLGGISKEEIEERDEMIDLQRREIEALKAEVQSAKQAERDARKEVYSTIGALRSNLNLVEKAKEELVSVVGEKDRLISQQRARIEALERGPIYHNDGTLPTSTSWPEIELPSDVRDRMRALNIIARWEEWFRFVDDAEFDDGAQAEVSSILEQTQSRGRLYELLMEGPLDTWYCLRCVYEHGAYVDGGLCTDHSCFSTSSASHRLVMVTVVDSARHLRFSTLG